MWNMVYAGQVQAAVVVVVGRGPFHADVAQGVDAVHQRHPSAQGEAACGVDLSRCSRPGQPDSVAPVRRGDGGEAAGLSFGCCSFHCSLFLWVGESSAPLGGIEPPSLLGPLYPSVRYHSDVEGSCVSFHAVVSGFRFRQVPKVCISISHNSSRMPGYYASFGHSPRSCL